MTADPGDREIGVLCVRAGVSHDEIHVDPEHGVMLSASAVRKLVAIAPNREAAAALVELVDVLVRRAAR